MDKWLHWLLQPKAFHPNEPLHNLTIINEHNLIYLINSKPNIKTIEYNFFFNHTFNSYISRYNPKLYNICNDSFVFKISY